MTIIDTIKRRIFGAAKATGQAIAAAAVGAAKTMNIATTRGVDALTMPEELKPILNPSKKEKKRQADVIKARNFHAGAQNSKLNKRLREFLCVDDDEFSLNIAASITLAVSERLLLEDEQPLTCDVEAPQSEKEAQEKWIRRIWRGSRLKFKQADIHEAAVRDGEYFVIVDYDNENKRVRFTPHQRYTDPQTVCRGGQGDGEGVFFIYPNNNANAKPRMAVQRWTELLDDGKSEKRIALYYPEKIVTYHRTGTGWHILKELDWVHPVTNEPLGIPVVAFLNPDRQPESKRAWVMLRAVNKGLLDLLRICDVAAFRIWLYAGWSPTEEGKPDGKPLTIEPGTWIGDASTKKEDFLAQPIEGTDPRPVSEVLDGLIFKVASITDTPASRLLMTRQVAAEGTLKQQAEPLLAKVRRRAGNFGSAYEDMFNIARRLESAFGSEHFDESILLDAQWESFDVRGADEELKDLAVEEKRVQIQLLKQQIGVSKKQSQRELDYDEEKIAMMENEKAEESEAAGTTFGQIFNRGAV